jgi:hypothetical protein
MAAATPLIGEVEIVKKGEFGWFLREINICTSVGSASLEPPDNNI